MNEDQRADGPSERMEDHGASANMTAPEQASANTLDDRLTYDDRGDIVVHMVWALKPGQPQIVAVCTSAEIAQKYESYVLEHFKAVFHVEKVLLDHAFGRRDVQTTIYRATGRLAGSESSSHPKT